ncbi:MAG: hypothetical protein H6828_13690 [Planctomycetes bacterium]|nr:hypothetical protein [Planctomycetota bacterium]
MLTTTGRALPALALALLAAGCAGRSRWPDFSTQQYPRPMRNAVSPLPPGAEVNHPPGPEEVVIGRLADPVQLQPAGESAAFPLRFFDKRRRANAGAWVYSAAGGRAEILWPSGTTVVLFDHCTAIVGSPSRGEPELYLLDVQRALLNLTEGDQVELTGGARLAADSGPWLVERRLFDILRVKNQSKETGEVSYRDEVFQLLPGETVDLPLLSAGGRPIPERPGADHVPGPGFEVEVYGDVDSTLVENGVRLEVGGEHEISALGVRLHLQEGERATFSGLGAGGAPLPEPRPTDPAASDTDTAPDAQPR